MDDSRRVNRFAGAAGLCGLLFGALACRPMLAIGWGEGVLIFLLLVLLIGPPVYRFLRWLEKARERTKK